MYTIENEFLKVKINSTGAQVHEVIKKESNRNYMWSKNADVWPWTSPNLFPIIGRLLDTCYSYQSIDYTMGLHGFTRDADFKCVEARDDRIVFEFQDNEETREQYPFSFVLRIEYQLKGNELTTLWHVSNTGDEALLYSVGGHPAFQLDAQENYGVKLDGDIPFKVFTLNDKGLINGTEESSIKEYILSDDLFRHDALIFEGVKSMTLFNQKNANSILTVDLHTMPYVGLWSFMKEGKMASFVCIEPWLGLPDFETSDYQFEHKPAMTKLEAGLTETSSYTIIIK